ncbi:MAG: flagellar basal body rod protein FlgB [Planctomycetes bacterium]|nr:flagellar basal body rod protein FlgB [Planctomycetota bacterium]
MTLQSIFSTHSIPILEQAMHFSNIRHKAIANNIANVETPGYKAVDASKKDFLEVLKRSINESKGYDTRQIIFRDHGSAEFTGQKPDYAFIERKNEGGILRHDDNNVDIDQEMTEMVKNRGLHNVSAQALSNQFQMLRSAIGGRVL